MLEEPELEEREEKMFELWPENLEVVEFFQIVCGQWRVVAGFGGARFLDLDHVAVESAMNMHGVPRAKRKQLFSDLRVMTKAALRRINRRPSG